MEYDIDLDHFDEYDAFVEGRKTKRQTTRPTTYTTQPSNLQLKKRRSPWQPLPEEIITAIFSLTSQRTLKCVSLVCRDWSRISRSMIRRVGVWKTMDENGHHQLLNQMPKINTLVCWFLKDPELPPAHWDWIDPNSTLSMWKRFLRASTKPSEEGPLLNHIKELVIHGDYISYKGVIAPLLPHLQYLQTLRLDFQKDHSTIDLFPILDHCSNLKELTIKGAVNKHLIIRVDSNDHDLTCAKVPEPPPKEELAWFYDQPTPTYPQRYGVLRIDFHEVIISQRTLERILVTCQLLDTLKATEMPKYRTVPSQPGVLLPVYLDRGRITRLAREFCPRMKWLALLQKFEPDQVWSTTDKPAKQGYGSQPPSRLYEWFVGKRRYLSASLEALDRQLIRNYRAQSILRFLTTLEITDTFARQEVHLGLLLSYTPCLEHFRASRAQFSIMTRRESYMTADGEHFYQTYISPKVCASEYKTNRERRMVARERGVLDLGPPHQASPSAIMRHIQKAREGKVRVGGTHWQCYNLRSLDVGLCHASDTPRLFTYLWQHCPLLRHLRVRCKSVQMGQSHYHNATPLFPLRDLRGLAQLETVTIYTDNIHGVSTGSEFEFLRRPINGKQSRCKKTRPPPMDTRRTIYEDDCGDDDTAVVLPCLMSMVFVFRSSIHKTDYRKVVETLEGMRPGVEFRFIERSTIDGAL
ncbi:hypothetical protein CPB97_006153 [Podila verticillata]|nr:hypothetical protein CPB97_006153 [Podila verticillata]